MREIVLITPPATFPVTLLEAKAQCRVDGDHEDVLIDRLVAAATARAQRFLRRRLIDQVVDVRVSRFARVFPIPLAPVIEVESLRYIDPDGDEQVWDGTLTLVGSHAPSVALSGDFPATAVRPDAVRVRLRAGYGADPQDVPDDIRHAVLMLIAHFYEHREAVVVGTSASVMPLAVESLLLPNVFWV